MSRPPSNRLHSYLLASAARSWAALTHRALKKQDSSPVRGRQSAWEPTTVERPYHARDQLLQRAEAGDIFPLYLDRLIEQVSPHAQPFDAGARQRQVSAGRRLLVRRLQRDLTLADIARLVAVKVSTIQLIEAGVADASLVPPEILGRLASILSDNACDREHVMQMLCEALGQAQMVRFQPGSRRGAENAMPGGVAASDMPTPEPSALHQSSIICNLH